MATANTSNLCTVCSKILARYFCNGCSKHLCPKDSKLHDQKLLLDFDNEIVSAHNQLLEHVQKLANTNLSLSQSFAQIEEWKLKAIKRVETAAEEARNTFVALINKQKIEIEQQVESLTKEIRCWRDEENFLETDIERLKSEINNIQTLVQRLLQKDSNVIMLIENDEVDWNQLVYIRVSNPIFPLRCPLNLTISPSARWQRHGVTVAGGRDGAGNRTNQLRNPCGLCIDDDQAIYIADRDNHRIIKWEANATKGRVVAGGNGEGYRVDQLSYPWDVILDKKGDSLIICDHGNRRVVRWPRRNGTNGETIISNIDCIGLTMDENGFLYVVNWRKDEVRRYGRDESVGTVVAGGNGNGNRLDQLDRPHYVFVDREHSVYVSDWGNARVMKWKEGATEGILVAGGQETGDDDLQLLKPRGLVVDKLGTLYVTDEQNGRIVRYSRGTSMGTTILTGDRFEEESSRLDSPTGLLFDKEGNLYVVDSFNHRVQRFHFIR